MKDIRNIYICIFDLKFVQFINLPYFFFLKKKTIESWFTLAHSIYSYTLSTCHFNINFENFAKLNNSVKMKLVVNESSMRICGEMTISKLFSQKAF